MSNQDPWGSQKLPLGQNFKYVLMKIDYGIL